ncbi:glutamine-hydrolyzing GMP synthase, partial [Singulisphaera rosea]
MEHPGLAERPVLVVDFGSQYVQLIARRVRERHAFAKIVRHDLTVGRARELNPLAIILSGGPSSVYEAGAPQCDPELFNLGVPVLGLCYGMQLACMAMGGTVKPGPAREFGRAECQVIDRSEDLLHDVPATMTVWMSHGDQVMDAGADFVPLATTSTCPVAAVKHRSRPVYGLQFHPEVAHTPYGALILGNFLDRICKSPGAWTMSAFV